MWHVRRGIDAPESAMPYGKEAKEALLKLVQGKSLKVYVYDEDRYGRCVGDIYCDGVFVQVRLHSLHLQTSTAETSTAVVRHSFCTNSLFRCKIQNSKTITSNENLYVWSIKSR